MITLLPHAIIQNYRAMYVAKYGVATILNDYDITEIIDTVFDDESAADQDAARLDEMHNHPRAVLAGIDPFNHRWLKDTYLTPLSHYADGMISSDEMCRALVVALEPPGAPGEPEEASVEEAAHLSIT